MSLPEQQRQLHDLSRLLKSESELSGLEAEQAKHAFLRRAHAQNERRARRVPVFFAALSFATIAAATLFFFWPQSLDYSVSGAKDEGGYVHANGAGNATLRFSDSTVIEASRGSRVRVAETEREGARIVLERGALDARVFHGERSRWHFVAGPFDVRVTGTKFDLSWDATEEVLDLVLHEGSVEVQGLSSSGPIAVVAGQSFHGDAKHRTMLLRDTLTNAAVAQTASDSTDPASGSPAASDAPPSPDATPEHPDTKLGPLSARDTHAALPKREPWSKLMAQGKFALVVSEAETRGLSGCLASCDAADLRALADAARYTGKSDLSAQSLHALRKRFASTEGRGAAFLLARLSENLGKKSEAEGWYDTYLRESPSGSFSSEALAGKMRVALALRGKANAAPIARDYLVRYPNGVHAKAAKEIVGQK